MGEEISHTLPFNFQSFLKLMVTGFIPSGYALVEHIDMIEAINHIDAHRFIHRTSVLMAAARGVIPFRVVIFFYPGECVFVIGNLL